MVKDSSKKLAVEDIYKKKTHHEHILSTPDTYIGSTEPDTKTMYVYDEDEKKIVKKDITLVPGLYKIYDEILVNARDHSIRDKTCKNIKVTLNREDGSISVYNDGKGIPVELHKELQIYVPEMIFGHLLTSSNYEQKGKIVGGKNGYGAKCLMYGTIVPLWNGQQKKVEDVVIGDILIGDDGTQRTIKNIIHGDGKIYSVNQQHGETYYVNENHILTLQIPDSKFLIRDISNNIHATWWDVQNKKIRSEYINKDMHINEFCETILNNTVFDIDIKDYMALDDNIKQKIEGICGKCVKWDKKEVLLNPYIMGLSLSNPSNNCYGEEIMNYLDKWSKKTNVSITSCLREYNLLSDKHIPNDYLINDYQTRLSLLAGLVDMNGTINDNNIMLVLPYGQKHEKLVEDIKFLVRSMGLLCQVVLDANNKFYNIKIAGNNLYDIPILLTRNKYKLSMMKKQTNSTGLINVSYAFNGQYVGFELDGNQRFVINDFTVTHNCANIYSTEFIVETYDKDNKKLYYQRFSDNMYQIDKPIIKTLTEKEAKDKQPFTQITFKPDFQRFGIKGLTKDIVSLFKKRVFDVSACTDKSVKVYLNDELIKVETFKDYIKLYYDKLPSAMVYDEQPRWKVGVLYDTNAGFVQMSFVNGVCTYKGGTHIDNVVEQITKNLITYIKEKKKVNVKAQYIRDNISIYLDSVIEDPAFSSQTKEYLTSKVSNFGSKWEMPTDFIKQLADTGIVDEVVKFAQFKEMTGLNKTDGKKVNSLRGIEKLDDANWAGTRKSKYCKLILTEGDSAKSFALAGLEIIGRDKYGVFPLRGKLLNVREASAKQILENKEFINIKKILGLKQNKKYNDVSQLRYGGIIILTDSDVDGSHIKGLIMNMFHTFWPSLMKIKGFIQSMATPIIKAFKKSDSKKLNPKIFYTLSDYKNWVQKELGGDSSKYTIKYYKGLGTSTEKEAKETFNEFDNRLIKYIWEQNPDDENTSVDTNKSNKSTKKNTTRKNIKEEEDSDDNENDNDNENENENEKDDIDEEDDSYLDDVKSKSYEAMTLAFSKERADDRKEWLFNYKPDNILEFNEKEVGYSDFVNKDLIHFSSYDNERSIPSVCDGFKPSQRKILYASLLKKLDHDEIKVAQLGAFVAEQTEYHHGEQSLQMAIITMAQDFVGSNNINLLQPIGNFGYRRMGGKEAASPRYIFTKLSEVTTKLFRKEDEPILNYIIEEGRQIEPKVYAPILPTILINGSLGIGTGFSTDIPMFNPKDVARNIIKLLDGDQTDFIHPWYKGFKGTIKKNGQDKYSTHGVYEILNENTVRVTEIPIGMSIDKYKETLESYIDVNTNIKDNKKDKKTPTYYVEKVIDNGGNNKVDFSIIFAKNYLQKFIKDGTLEKHLKLTGSISLTNMYLHNSKGNITKYEFIEDIFTDFYSWRLTMYKTRKDYRVKYLENQMNLLKYKVKFIEQKLSGEIIIEKRREQDILDELLKKGYPKLCNDCNAEDEMKTFRYITDMPLFSLTKEKIDKLNDEYKAKKKEYEEYKAITLEQLWKREVEEFIEAYDKWIELTKDEDVNEKKIKVKAKKNKH